MVSNGKWGALFSVYLQQGCPMHRSWSTSSLLKGCQEMVCHKLNDCQSCQVYAIDIAACQRQWMNCMPHHACSYKGTKFPSRFMYSKLHNKVQKWLADKVRQGFPYRGCLSCSKAVQSGRARGKAGMRWGPRSLIFPAGLKKYSWDGGCGGGGNNWDVCLTCASRRSLCLGRFLAGGRKEFGAELLDQSRKRSVQVPVPSWLTFIGRCA